VGKNLCALLILAIHGSEWSGSHSSFPVPFNTKLGMQQYQSGCGSKEKSLSLPGIEPGASSP